MVSLKAAPAWQAAELHLVTLPRTPPLTSPQHRADHGVFGATRDMRLSCDFLRDFSYDWMNRHNAAA